MQRAGWLTLRGDKHFLFFEVSRIRVGYRLYLGWKQGPREYFYPTRAECFAVLRLIRCVAGGQ